MASIRLTKAFVEGECGLEIPASIGREARRLRRWAWISGSFGVIIFLVAVVLLVHVDRGRRITQQLQAVWLPNDAAMRQLSVARIASTGAGNAQLHCSALTFPGPAVMPAAHNGPKAPALCARLQHALFSMRLVYRELRIWNVTSGRLSYVSPITWFTPDPTLSPDVSVESTELRTSVLITATIGSVLPMLLGLLGAGVYVYREIGDAIRTATLAAREGLHGTLRILLGAILQT